MNSLEGDRISGLPDAVSKTIRALPLPGQVDFRRRSEWGLIR